MRQQDKTELTSTANSNISETLNIDPDLAGLLSKALGVRGQLFIELILQMNSNTNVAHIEQQILANKVDASRSYVSKVLKDFESERLIVTGRGWIQVNPYLFHYGDDNIKRKREFAYRFVDKKMRNSGQ